MKVYFGNQQELETDGIISIKQEEAQTVAVKYPSHTVRLQGVTASEVLQKVDMSKSHRSRLR
jgi:hypothetical protein